MTLISVMVTALSGAIGAAASLIIYCSMVCFKLRPGFASDQVRLRRGLKPASQRSRLTV
jgi:hypothetical protein